MTYAVIGMAATCVAMGVALAAMGLRLGTVKADGREADAMRQDAESRLADVAADWAEYKLNTEAEREHWQSEIAQMESDLEKCTDPAIVRHRMRRLLS